MIHQVASVQNKTEPLPKLNKDLIRARHIQARLKERSPRTSLPDVGEIWSPIIAGPHLVSITRWIE